MSEKQWFRDSTAETQKKYPTTTTPTMTTAEKTGETRPLVTYGDFSASQTSMGYVTSTQWLGIDLTHQSISTHNRENNRKRSCLWFIQSAGKTGHNMIWIKSETIGYPLRRNAINHFWIMMVTYKRAHFCCYCCLVFFSDLPAIKCSKYACVHFRSATYKMSKVCATRPQNLVDE